MPTQAEEIRAVLDKTPLFSYLEEPILESLVSKFEIISYDLGDTIIQSGDPGDSFYVIFNATSEARDFTLPAAHQSGRWTTILDTALADPFTTNEAAPPWAGEPRPVLGHALVVLTRTG